MLRDLASARGLLKLEAGLRDALHLVCGVLVPPLSLNFRSFFSTRSSRANLCHLAAELCKAGPQHDPLGEELGQATQKRGGVYSHERLGSTTYRDMNGL